jgi:la-related protein 1
MNGLYGTSPLFGSAGSGVGSAKRSGAVFGSSPRTGGGSGGHGGMPGTSYGLGTSAPLAKFQHPSHALLESQGFKQIVYKKYHKRCLEERAQKGEFEQALTVILHIVSTSDRLQGDWLHV